MTHSILIVEDDPLQQKMLQILVQRQLNLGCHIATHGGEALDILGRHPTIQLVILDIDMPIMDGMQALDIIKQRFPAISVIMLTSNNDIKTAIKAMKLGALDFLTKPYQETRVITSIKNALHLNIVTKELARLKQETEKSTRFNTLVGHDLGLLETVTMGRKAATSDFPVLITGETGAGKEMIAKAIHGESLRAGAPFIAINCGAIPEQLAESILFGHEKGAFTGATHKTIGKFREANGGTIFLDEIGELPLPSQVKILRALQEKEVEAVGSNQSTPINVRILAATNRDLQAEMEAGRFRQDLYFRLNVLQISVPPLRDRRRDIMPLAHHFIERICAENGMIPYDLSPETAQQLLQYDWPGNVRELENVIKRAVVFSEGQLLSSPNLAAPSMHQSAPDTQPRGADTAYSIYDHNGDLKTLETVERDLLQFSLADHDHNITHAAKAIGIAKSTFYRKMKTLSLAAHKT